MIPTFLSELVRTVVIMTITGSLLCLLLLAIKPVIRHRLPKSAQYYFWLVVLGALLVPVSRFVVLPEAAPNIAPIYTIVEQNVVSVAENFTRVNTEIIHHMRPDLSRDEVLATYPGQFITIYDDFGTPVQEVAWTPSPPSRTIVVINAFMRVYPWVVALVLVYSLIGYARFIKKLRRGYVCPGDLELNMLSELANGKRAPRLIKSTFAATPMLVGVFRPTIVLPDREYTHEQLQGILRHELTHMRRYDVVVKWFSLFACALHWFNPLVWIARRQIDRACELACDEAVVRNMDANNKQNYGETLIAVTGDKKIPLPVLSTTMCAEKQAIKERLTAIMKSKKHTKLAILVSALILIGVVATACALGAAGRSATGSDDYTFMGRIIADGRRVFVLENMTDYERLTQMTSITLYADGTATVANALISSFLAPGSQTTFVIEENELVIYWERPETVTPIARLAIIDNDTLEFLSTDVPLRAEVGARYVFTPDWRGIFGDIEQEPDVDISASAMEVHALLASGMSVAELEAELGVTAENIQNAYDGRHNVYRFNLMTTRGYVNPSISDGDIDWHGLRNGLVRIIAHIQYETHSGTVLHSVIYSPSRGRAYIIGTSGARTDVSDMLGAPAPLYDHGELAAEDMIQRASSLNMLAFSAHADDNMISDFIDTFRHVHEVNAVYWDADWHHTLVFWVNTAVHSLSLEILGETVVTLTSPSHDEALILKVAPSHYLQPCGVIIITEENGTQHRIYFIQDMGSDIIGGAFWPYVLLHYEGETRHLGNVHWVSVFESDLPRGFAGFTIPLYTTHALPAWVGNDGFFIVPNNEPNRLFYLQIAQLTDYTSAEEWVYSIIERANIESQIIAGVDANRTYTPPTADFPFFAMERLPASEEGYLMQRFARDNGKGGIFLISIFLTQEQWEGWHGEALLSALAGFEILPPAAPSELSGPFVVSEFGRFTVHGFGGHISYDPQFGSFYFAGSGFNIAQLQGEPIEGHADVTQDSLQIHFAVGRDFSEYTGIVHGTLEGPGVRFAYNFSTGLVDFELIPYEIGPDRDEYFIFAQENAIVFAQMLRQALALIENYINMVP